MTACRMTVPTTRARPASPVLRFNSPNYRRHRDPWADSINIVVLNGWCRSETKVNVDLRYRLDRFAVSFGWGKPPRSQCSDRILVKTKPDGLTVRKTFIQPLTSNVASIVTVPSIFFSRAVRV